MGRKRRSQPRKLPASDLGPSPSPERSAAPVFFWFFHPKTAPQISDAMTCRIPLTKHVFQGPTLVFHVVGCSSARGVTDNKKCAFSDNACSTMMTKKRTAAAAAAAEAAAEQPSSQAAKQPSSQAAKQLSSSGSVIRYLAARKPASRQAGQPPKSQTANQPKSEQASRQALLLLPLKPLNPPPKPGTRQPRQRLHQLSHSSSWVLKGSAGSMQKHMK